MRRLRFVLITVLLVAVVTVLAAPLAAQTAAPTAPVAPATALTPGDWRGFGHDAQHSFVGPTSLDALTVHALAPAWFFPTGDAVTANPIVVNDTVYFGSWDGFFYAVDRTTGALRWKYQLKAQSAIHPGDGEHTVRDPTSDGGLVTASAWFEPGKPGNGRARPDLVIVPGGYTLYAFVATGPNAGQLYWSHDYTGLPEQPASPDTDQTRIFSSPVVSKNRVIFGVAPDGEDGHRGYIAAADLDTGNPVWRFETNVDAAGVVHNDGCGSVWTSPALDEARGLVTFGIADCNDLAPPPYAERVVALKVSDGKPAWVFTPPRLDGVPSGQEPACDFDFGAGANLGAPDPASGAPTFLGVGGKDGTYYRINPATGALVWQRNVVFGGLAGGFIGTTAFDGSRVYGATALGDLSPCSSDPRDTPAQEPSMHAIGADGTVAWEQAGSQAPGSTTVAAGMTFVGNIARPEVQIRDAATGLLLQVLPLGASCFGSIAVAGNTVFVPTGSPEQAPNSGVYAFTPAATPPTR